MPDNVGCWTAAVYALVGIPLGLLGLPVAVVRTLWAFFSGRIGSRHQQACRATGLPRGESVFSAALLVLVFFVLQPVWAVISWIHGALFGDDPPAG